MTINMLNVKHWKEEQRVIEWDAISYYAYLPAAFIYNDLSLSFTDGYDGPHKFVFWPEKGPDRKICDQDHNGTFRFMAALFCCGTCGSTYLREPMPGAIRNLISSSCLSAHCFIMLTGLIYLRRFCWHMPPI